MKSQVPVLAHCLSKLVFDCGLRATKSFDNFSGLGGIQTVHFQIFILRDRTRWISAIDVYRIQEGTAHDDFSLLLGVKALARFNGGAQDVHSYAVYKSRQENCQGNTESIPVCCTFACALVEELLLPRSSTGSSFSRCGQEQSNRRDEPWRIWELIIHR